MKIGILTNTYPPIINGVSVAVSSLEQKLIEAGHEVYIATPKPDEQFVQDNVYFIRASKLPEEISPDLKVPHFFIQQATKFFQEKEIEIIHSHDTIMGGPEATMIALNLGIPAVHTFHTHIEVYKYMAFPGYQTFIKNYVREVCNAYQHVITPSQKMYHYLLERGVRVPMSQVYNIPQTEELDQPVDGRVIDRLRELGITDSDKVVITFSRLGEEKGVYEAIIALEAFLKREQKRKFLIAGWGPQENELRELVVDLDLTDQVIFWGRYQRSQLSSLASISSIFIFPSRSENLPTNLFEAMYLGLPCICVDDDSVNYLLKHQANGFKIPESEFEAHLTSLLSDQEMLDSFSQVARESARSIDPQAILQEHITIYRDAIQRYHAEQDLPTVREQIRQSSQKLLQSTYQYLRGTYEGLNDFFDLPFNK
jgi:1,2-diacylglycerol 3-alpha-glucosyltransferase